MSEVLIPISDIPVIDRQQPKDWDSFDELPSSDVIKYSNYSLEDYGITDEGTILLPAENGAENLKNAIHANRPLRLNIECPISREAAEEFQDELNRLSLDPKMVAIDFRTAFPDENETENSGKGFLSIRFNPDSLPTARGLVIIFGDNFSKDEYWGMARGRFENLIVEDFATAETLYLFEKLGNISLQVLNELNATEAEQAIASHEFSHVVRHADLQRVNSILEDYDDFAASDEMYVAHLAATVLDEAISMFHTLRGQQVIQGSFTESNLSLYYLFSQLQSLVSHEISSPTFTYNFRNTQVSIQTLLDSLSSDAYEDIEYDIHDQALLILLAGPDSIEPNGDSVANLNSSFDTEFIYERINQIIENPYQFLSTLTPEFYDRLVLCFNSRIQQFIDAEDRYRDDDSEDDEYDE